MTRTSSEKGIALVIALMIGLAVSLLVMSTLYFVFQSTAVSGAGKRYATASEAADGAADVMKDAIHLILLGEPLSGLPIVDGEPPCLTEAVMNDGKMCTTKLILPGVGLFDEYSVHLTVMRLYSSSLPGSSLEFARAGAGAPGASIYFRISTLVTGPGNTRAETTALYRDVL